MGCPFDLVEVVKTLFCENQLWSRERKAAALLLHVLLSEHFSSRRDQVPSFWGLLSSPAAPQPGQQGPNLSPLGFPFSPPRQRLCDHWGVLSTLRILFPVISVEISVYFSGRKHFPVLLKFKEKMTSMFCHLYKRQRKIGKCFNYLKMLLLYSDRFKPFYFIYIIRHVGINASEIRILDTF